MRNFLNSQEIFPIYFNLLHLISKEKCLGIKGIKGRESLAIAKLLSLAVRNGEQTRLHGLPWKLSFIPRSECVVLRGDIYGNAYTCSHIRFGSMFGRVANPEFRRSLFMAHALGMPASTGCSFEQVVLGACR